MLGEENETEVEKGHEEETKERMERSSAETGCYRRKRPKTQTVEMNGKIPIGTTGILIQYK